MILTAVSSGAYVTAFGHYMPFMWLGAAFSMVDSALIHTLNVDSGPDRRDWYQLLAGIGFGIKFQTSYSALNIVLVAEDLPTGNALVVFFQAIGALWPLALNRAFFSSSLFQESCQTTSADSRAIIAAEATLIATAMPIELVEAVRQAYSYALSRTFILPIASAGLAFFSCLGMGWNGKFGAKSE